MLALAPPASSINMATNADLYLPSNPAPSEGVSTVKDCIYFISSRFAYGTEGTALARSPGS